MKFSIITVTRNNLAGLKKTQESIAAQTCRRFEWIIIDGNSTDGTAALLPELQATILSEPDTGIYDAMNKGLVRAHGQYLLFLNAGDCLAAPETLERLLTYCDGSDFIYGDALEGEHYKTARSHHKILMGMFTHHQSMLYRREALGTLHYDTTYRIAADYKFTTQFLLNADQVLYAPFPICNFEPGGISQTAAQEGRMEQFCVREELKSCHGHINAALYLAQTAQMGLRNVAPGLYWAIKRG